MLKRTILSLSFLTLFLHASPCLSGNAELLLSPTRIVFEGGAKYATVTVRNNGDGVGRYKIELVDTTMNENGGIKVREDGSKDAFSAQDIISLSPRSMTLKPDENQAVRILVKKTEGLADGEYKSHLQVRMTENDLDLKTGKQVEKGAGISLKPKMTTVIPVIVRKGETSYTVSLDEAQLVIGGGEEKKTPQVKCVFGFSGNRSVLGDIKVVHTAPNGTETELAFFRGVAIYRGVPKREQLVALKVPEGVNIQSGKLLVSYMSQENEGSKVLTSKEITP